LNLAHTRRIFVPELLIIRRKVAVSLRDAEEQIPILAAVGLVVGVAIILAMIFRTPKD
jgi:hypothetical protein